MHTRNEILIRGPLETCLRAGMEVERWPDILPHYREVRFLRRDGPGAGRVRMAASRDFGPVPYPVWWVSEMVTDGARAEIRYRHVEGITRGMEVSWRLQEAGDGTRIVILHDWDGPRWPALGGVAASLVIGPGFIRVVADRTLKGIRRHVESGGRPGTRARAAAGALHGEETRG
ncbi:MAG: SRPBCC family protein [Gemmatimonadota bacterium]